MIRNRVPGPLKCKELYSQFLLLFPNYDERVSTYQPYDRMSIRLLISNRHYIFTYVDEKNWGFQTEKNYLEVSKAIR